jgi:hypothetical protein
VCVPCVVRGSFFSVKFFGENFFDKKNFTTDDRRPTKYARIGELHDDDDDDAHGTMEREKHPKAHHHAWSRRDHDTNDTNDTNARSRCDFVVDIFFGVHKTNASLLRRFALCFSSRFLSALLTYVRLRTRDATRSIFVGVTKLFLFVVSLFAF